ncbi:phosphatase [Ruminococcaceae bacterium OttesenSCG-928-O06]|nr:phosphatase [Ruminococcaceae bacterium OttesenSCG-928-O06]
MRKSTVVALFVALAAVAGVLGALYVYILRRERELDEYEQLLFSEDFNDDLLDPIDTAEEAPAGE